MTCRWRDGVGNVRGVWFGVEFICCFVSVCSGWPDRSNYELISAGIWDGKVEGSPWSRYVFPDADWHPAFADVSSDKRSIQPSFPRIMRLAGR